MLAGKDISSAALGQQHLHSLYVQTYCIVLSIIKPEGKVIYERVMFCKLNVIGEGQHWFICEK